MFCVLCFVFCFVFCFCFCLGGFYDEQRGCNRESKRDPPGKPDVVPLYQFAALTCCGSRGRRSSSGGRGRDSGGRLSLAERDAALRRSGLCASRANMTAILAAKVEYDTAATSRRLA